jgi:hypothetical protein
VLENRYNPNAIADFMDKLHLELPDQKVDAQVEAMMYRYDAGCTCCAGHIWNDNS